MEPVRVSPPQAQGGELSATHSSRISLACICGEVLHIDVDVEAQQSLRRGWEAVHSGSGHGPTDAAGAARARLSLAEALLSGTKGGERKVYRSLLKALWRGDM